MNTYISDGGPAPVRTSVADAPIASAVSWGAILAGAAAAAALSLILLVLGTGLGLSSVSPWVHEGVSAETFGVSTIIWLAFTSIAASALGGYLAGRLRTRWLSVHIDEVHFRDTAHGFLTWAVSTLATAALLTSTIASVVGAGTQAGAAMVGGVAHAAIGAGVAAATGPGESAGNRMDYYIDQMFRDANGLDNGSADGVDSAATTDASDAPAATDDTTDPALATTAAAADPMRNGRRGMRGNRAWPRREVQNIFGNALTQQTLPDEDVRYLGSVLARRNGLTQQDAEQRVRDSYTRLQAQMQAASNSAKEAADKARKASAHAALWMFIALLSGAFVASLMATFGGRQRDA